MGSLQTHELKKPPPPFKSVPGLMYFIMVTKMEMYT